MDESIWVRKTSSIWTCPRTHRSTNIEGLFNVTTNLIADNTEIRNVKRLEWGSHSWTRSTLFNDRAIQLTKAKVYVNSDSAWCLGGICTTGDAIEQWKGQVATFREENHSFSELWEWMENQLNSSGNFSQDSQHCRFFTPSYAIWRGPHIKPEKFSDRIIFMSMFNDKTPTRKEMRILVLWHPPMFEKMLRDCVWKDIGHS